MQKRAPSRRRLALASALCLGLAACAGGSVSPSPSAVANASPDARGVITYASYQVAVAREGDTVATLAARVGGSADEISRLNGLPPDYRMRAGEVLVLPDSVPRSGVGASPTGWTPEGAAAAIDAAPAGASGTAQQPNPFNRGQTEPLIDPVRHRVEAGETAYSIARLYGVSVTSLASWNGLGPDFAIRVGQELLIPVTGSANRISSTFDSSPGTGTAVPPPPIGATPLPENVAPGENPASPDLGQFRTPAGGRLQAPVSGPIKRSYNAANPSGVGYDVPVGTPVRAASSGAVALISEEIGGGGAIVLLSHSDDVLTTYSVLDNVTLEKGQRVEAGQVIGTVAARQPQEMQFDVFRGTEPLDPTIYLGG
ncbi:LysM peptidoglycan-binding domain-containing protein [Amaricoccus sp.]|uniref:LysM peptidoglycan-binding domain-containing protein n=1 Tax=Amaricoccus sp. TaxID=1872485 RepID=UPI001B4274B7|nr:LysM peptidoglycan-binding domain-containing protein [Amaricoccus sp.]MBP7241509.1 LysM peptidoglycan-binding domain-containing protein [Amaricoccus sp.]